MDQTFYRQLEKRSVPIFIDEMPILIEELAMGSEGPICIGRAGGRVRDLTFFPGSWVREPIFFLDGWVRIPIFIGELADEFGILHRDRSGW